MKKLSVALFATLFAIGSAFAVKYASITATSSTGVDISADVNATSGSTLQQKVDNYAALHCEEGQPVCFTYRIDNGQLQSKPGTFVE